MLFHRKIFVSGIVQGGLPSVLQGLLSDLSLRDQ